MHMGVPQLHFLTFLQLPWSLESAIWKTAVVLAISHLTVCNTKKGF